MYNNIKRWTIIGGIFGLIGVLSALFSIFSPLPLKPTFIIGFLFGPFLAIGLMGLYFFISYHRESPSALIGVVFGIIACSIVNTMLVVQGAIKIIMYKKIDQTVDIIAKDSLKQTLNGLHTIHLGMDVAWDIFIGLSLLFFGISTYRITGFKLRFTYLTIILGIAILVLNIWTFPIPPANAGLFDIGPIAAIYFIFLFIWLLTRSRHFEPNPTL
ncbi:MAG: hypothetical protein RDU14_07780 [Melioribacteraceae bacterium]|nr:hypothetical protein [Melioribacteraceae bacterium]